MKEERNLHVASSNSKSRITLVWRNYTFFKHLAKAVLLPRPHYDVESGDCQKILSIKDKIKTFVKFSMLANSPGTISEVSSLNWTGPLTLPGPDNVVTKV
jgi:hypothetical protein